MLRVVGAAGVLRHDPGRQRGVGPDVDDAVAAASFLSALRTALKFYELRDNRKS